MAKNPLGRLHDILLKISKSNSNSPYEVFASIFNLGKNDKGSILVCYSELFKLCEESRVLINTLDVNHDTLLAPINGAILALSKIDFNEPNGLMSVKHCLDGQLLASLEICSEMLPTAYKEKELEPSTLDELYHSLNSLREFIDDRKINLELKTILKNHINNMDISISKYKLYGTPGIKSELTSTIGDIVINNHLATTEDEKLVIEKVLTFMSKVNTAISFCNNISPLLPGIINLIN